MNTESDMSQCKICSSWAINHHKHGRDGSDADLCDVCYWRTKAELKAPHETEKKCGLSDYNTGLAETALSRAGVFKGAHGLEGLLNAREFWEKQPYGTRLYYGEGNLEYLHRDILCAAVEVLKTIATGDGL